MCVLEREREREEKALKKNERIFSLLLGANNRETLSLAICICVQILDFKGPFNLTSVPELLHYYKSVLDVSIFSISA